MYPVSVCQNDVLMDIATDVDADEAVAYPAKVDQSWIDAVDAQV